MCLLLALLGDHPILHVSRIRVNIDHGIFTEVEHRLKLMYHIAFEVLVNNLISTAA